MGKIEDTKLSGSLDLGNRLLGSDEHPVYPFDFGIPAHRIDFLCDAAVKPHHYNITLPKISSESHGQHRERTEALARELLENNVGLSLLQKSGFNGKIFIAAEPDSTADKALKSFSLATRQARANQSISNG